MADIIFFLSGEYVLFDAPLDYDYMYTAFSGAALFLVTIQLLKPLTFNQHFAIMQASLKLAAGIIFWYTLIFLVMLTAFAILAYVCLGYDNDNFMDPGKSYLSLFGKKTFFRYLLYIEFVDISMCFYYCCSYFYKYCCYSINYYYYYYYYYYCCCCCCCCCCCSDIDTDPFERVNKDTSRSKMKAKKRKT